MPAAKVLELTAQPAWSRFEAIADGYQRACQKLDRSIWMRASRHTSRCCRAGFRKIGPPGLCWASNPPTPAGYAAAVRKTFGDDKPTACLALYPARPMHQRPGSRRGSEAWPPIGNGLQHVAFWREDTVNPAESRCTASSTPARARSF